MTTNNAVDTNLSGQTGTGKFTGNNLPSIVTGFLDVNGNLWISQGATASAVNYVDIINSATGNPVQMVSSGTDTNIILELQGKGTGGAAVQGTSTNDNASSGYVGEFIFDVIPNASAVPLSDSVFADVTSISVPAGDWDITGNVWIAASGPVITGSNMFSNIVSATQPDISLVNALSGSVMINVALSIPSVRYSFSTTTTIYLSCGASFASGSANARGGIYARRVR